MQRKPSAGIKLFGRINHCIVCVYLYAVSCFQGVIHCWTQGVRFLLRSGEQSCDCLFKASGEKERLVSGLLSSTPMPGWMTHRHLPALFPACQTNMKNVIHRVNHFSLMKLSCPLKQMSWAGWGCVAQWFSKWGQGIPRGPWGGSSGFRKLL